MEIEYAESINYRKYKVPNRNDFADTKYKSSLDRSVIANKEIYIHPNAISEYDEKIASRNRSSKYRVYLYSVLLDGRKVLVIVENIPLYIDILMPMKENGEQMDAREFEITINDKISSHKVEKTEIVQFYPFNGFVINKLNYYRLYFENSFNRSEVLRELKKLDYTLASDDEKSYYATFIRKFKINACGWNTITDYTVENNNNNKQLSYVFYVDYLKITPISDDFIEKHDVKLGNAFSKNKVLVMTYDLETHQHNETGEAPKPDEIKTYDIFMCGITFHWYYDPEPFKKICLTTKSSKGRKDRDTVICNSERELLESFLEIVEKMAPDLLLQFNGGSFDTPCLFYKMKDSSMLMQAKKKISCKAPKYRDSEDSLADITSFRGKYNALIKEEHVKISADESVSVWRFNVDGLIEIDVMIIMRQIFPKSQVGRQYSLNFFLKKNKLDSKEPMSYKEMDRIYVSPTSEENMIKMDLVSQYCVVDALRCQQLMCKQSVIDERRELCNMTFLGIFEGLYRANGMKVRNVLAANAHDRGIAFSNIRKSTSEQGKYPGAYVFYPVRGWHNKLPVTGLDYSSLYPSIMMTYNLSPEMLVRTLRDKERYEAMGYDLYKISFPFNGKTKTAWFVRHNNVMEANGKRKNVLTNEESPSLENEKMGLFPSILKGLKDDRKIYKNKFVEYSAQKEHMEATAGADVDISKDPAYNELCFKRTKMDSKQKGKKVVMNTFYGEAGNPLSPIRELLVAGGTTSIGQLSLKFVADIVIELGCSIVYGDSVTGETPILCRENDKLVYRTIEELSNSNWIPYNGNKEYSNTYIEKLEVWTEKGFTKINKVIRHKTDKDIYRVLTNTGYVEVTEDHSLLDKQAEKITPKDVKIGSELLHSNLPINEIDCGMSNDEIFNMAYENTHGRIPVSILNATQEQKHMYIKGYEYSHNKSPYSLIGRAELYYLLSSLYDDVKISMNYLDDIILSNSTNDSDNPDKIKKIENIGKNEGYVYDLETENHHFSAGIGRMIVHNTDSVYITCPPECYAEIDKEYEEGKLTKMEYATKKVEITMVKMKEIRDIVNQRLKENNGTEFLKMAYEEVLFPAQYNGKKLYSGIAHEDIPNFYPKDIFKRGGEYVKGGRSELLYMICDMYMKERYHPDNWEKETMDIVEGLLRHIYEESWDLQLFTKKSKYKPHKKNVSVLTFVDRVKEARERYKDDAEKLALYPMPDPGDTITTVVIKPTMLHDLRGMKLKLSIGDRMEYVDVYKYYNEKNKGSMKIDLRYYLDSGIINTFSRFICHYPQFQPNVKQATSEEELEYIDTYSVDKAEKYLIDFCNNLEGVNDNEMKIQNKIYKQFYKKTLSYVEKCREQQIGPAAFLIKTDDLHLDQTFKITSYYNLLRGNLREEAVSKYQGTWGLEYIKLLKRKTGYSINKIKKIYNNPFNGLIKIKMRTIARHTKIVENEMKNNISIILPIILDGDKKIMDFIMDMRKIETELLEETEIDIEEIEELLELREDEMKAINELYKSYAKLGALLNEHVQMYDLYKALDSKLNNGMIRPDVSEMSDILTITDHESLDVEKYN